MYEIYRRTLNGKLRFIAEFETIEHIVAGFWKGDDILDYFGYTDIDRKKGNHTLFGESHAKYDWTMFEGTSYKYIVEHNGKIVTPDHLIGVWRDWVYHHRLTWDERWKRKRYRKRQGSKPHAYGGYRKMRTMQERRMAHAWDDEEFAPKVRSRRSADHLPDSWWDIRWFVSKSWKDQSKRKHQWKPKKGE